MNDRFFLAYWTFVGVASLAVIALTVAAVVVWLS